MTDCYELVRLVAQAAAEGHASLNKLAITYSGSYKEPSAEELINRVISTEAIGHYAI
jgi:hypothetical protein